MAAFIRACRSVYAPSALKTSDFVAAHLGMGANWRTSERGRFIVACALRQGLWSR